MTLPDLSDYNYRASLPLFRLLIQINVFFDDIVRCLQGSGFKLS